jgi:hypothetical protein
VWRRRSRRIYATCRRHQGEGRASRLPRHEPYSQPPPHMMPCTPLALLQPSMTCAMSSLTDCPPASPRILQAGPVYPPHTTCTVQPHKVALALSPAPASMRQLRPEYFCYIWMCLAWKLIWRS